MRLLKYWTSEGGCLVEGGAYFWVGAYSNRRQILTPGKGAYSPMLAVCAGMRRCSGKVFRPFGQEQGT